jgi:hypothetical protein
MVYGSISMGSTSTQEYVIGIGISVVTKPILLPILLGHESNPRHRYEDFFDIVMKTFFRDWRFHKISF